MAEVTSVDDMLVGNVDAPIGRGDKLMMFSVTGQDTDEITTGLDNITAAVANSDTDGQIASITDITGGTITIGLTADDGSAVTSDTTIYVFVAGHKN